VICKGGEAEWVTGLADARPLVVIGGPDDFEDAGGGKGVRPDFETELGGETWEGVESCHGGTIADGDLR